jgi:hypothetical protein
MADLNLLSKLFQNTYTLLAVPLAFVVAYLVTQKVRSKGPLPPGPRGLPLIGNALEMPKDHEWEHWAKHKDLYGTFILGCQPHSVDLGCSAQDP